VLNTCVFSSGLHLIQCGIMDVSQSSLFSSNGNQNGQDAAKADEDTVLDTLDLLPVANDDEVGSVAFQVVSLDENALLNVWVVVEFPSTSSLPDKEGVGDIHLKFDSRLRITQSGSLSFPHESVRALTFAINPQDTSSVLVGCDTGM
jgi:hypothetical protein